MVRAWIAALVLVVLAACTDQEEAAQARLDEVQSVLKTLEEGASYARQAKVYQEVVDGLDALVQEFPETEVAAGIKAGDIPAAKNRDSLASILAVAVARAPKEMADGGKLLDFSHESAVVRSFFTGAGSRCTEEAQQLACKGYRDQISVRVLAQANRTEAVVLDVMQKEGSALAAEFLTAFLPLYDIEAVRFSSLIESIASGLESRYVSGALRVSGIMITPGPVEPVYRIVLRDAARTAALMDAES
jgi:hypothetical protein